MPSPRDTYDRISAWLLIGLGVLVLLSAAPTLVLAVRDGGWGNVAFVLVLILVVSLGMTHAVRRLQRSHRPPGGRGGSGGTGDAPRPDGHA